MDKGEQEVENAPGTWNPFLSHQELCKSVLSQAFSHQSSIREKPSLRKSKRKSI
jgi:hypothetical protein